MATGAVILKRNRVPEVARALQSLLRQQVMVGIPKDERPRKDPVDGKSTPITNAALLYIHDHGAPEVGIPKRESLVPGVRSVQPKINSTFVRIAKKVMDINNDPGPIIDRGLNVVGMIAVAGVKNRIENGPYIPLAEATLKARMARGHDVTINESLLRTRELGHAVLSSVHAELTGAKPLIDTAQMMNAVTYVIRDKGAP